MGIPVLSRLATEVLADQVFAALQVLLRGFEAAARRDRQDLLFTRALQGARAQGSGEVYAGLLSVLLRLVFVLYAEERGLLPVDNAIYRGGYSLLGLFDELERDQAADPEAMDRRFGAWSRLLGSWRAIYEGVHHRCSGEGQGPSLLMPPRRGQLFDPEAYAFLEGRRGGEELGDSGGRAAVAVPSVDDGTLYRVLDGLLYLHEGKIRQRLSYRALSVEQIGNVYEALMGYDIECLPAPAVRMRARRAKGVWVSAKELLAVAPGRRGKWLKESAGLDRAPSMRLAKALAAKLKDAGANPSGEGLDTAAAEALTLGILAEHAGGRAYGERAAVGRLVIQPSNERKRTGSHYTPRQLTESVVRRTLAPLLRTMEAESGGPPTSEALLKLKIVDPAMGSGAFLVEVVRQLADHVVAAWQREGHFDGGGPLLPDQERLRAPKSREEDCEAGEVDREGVKESRAPGEEGRASGEVGRAPGEVGRASGEVGREAGEEGCEAGEMDRGAVKEGRAPGEVGRASGEVGRAPGETGRDAGELADSVVAARRLVAQRCVYGVDKNPHAVNLAKLSLWLVTHSRDQPFSFVDHALRCGDSLVGLDRLQVAGFDWRIGGDAGVTRGARDDQEGLEFDFLSQVVARSLAEATELRRQLVALASTDREAVLERERLLERAREAPEQARIVADLCLGAFFSAATEKARQELRRQRLQVLSNCLSAHNPGSPAGGSGVNGDPANDAQIEAWRRQLLAKQTPFHWPLEFPEVFFSGPDSDPDPDDPRSTRRAKRGYFDAVVGNPPFAGKNGVLAVSGEQYLDWLKVVHPGTHGNADLCAHFFRRAQMLLGPRGSFGLVATNTIGQGDSRTTGLAALVAEGAVIYDATIDLRWPAPGAAVRVSIVHMAMGSVALHLETPVLRTVHPGCGRLVARQAQVINSRLVARPERADPVSLASNGDLSFQGSIVLGMGFTLTPAERDALVNKDKGNAARIRPYLGGAEVNRNPNQGFDRWVIDFGDMPLEKAERWPDLISIVRRQVKPEREKLRDNGDGKRRKRLWWRWGRRTPALDAALAKVPRCFVTSQVTKHLVWSSQTENQVYSNTIVVVPLSSLSAFAVLQSRVHERWARALASSMKSDLRYTPSDCFRNFPFPSADPRRQHRVLAVLGERLEGLRRQLMQDHRIGLTTTYNLLLGFEPGAADDARHRLHEPAIDPRLGQLAQLHVELDRAVLDTYAECLLASRDPDERELAPLFAAIAVPPLRDLRLRDLQPAERRMLGDFNDALLDALMALNGVRARQEAVACT